MPEALGFRRPAEAGRAAGPVITSIWRAGTLSIRRGRPQRPEAPPVRGTSGPCGAGQAAALAHVCG